MRGKRAHSIDRSGEYLHIFIFSSFRLASVVATSAWAAALAKFLSASAKSSSASPLYIDISRPHRAFYRNLIVPEVVSEISSRPVSVTAGYNLAPRFVMLFVGLPSLRGDALFGGPFSSWQVASSSTSLTSGEAAPDVNEPQPFALSGASPSLHARHEEQRFMFLLESFEWLHWWHGHDEARRVADSSVGILLREGKREGDWYGASQCGTQSNMFTPNPTLFI
jgi:hypothetical protein